MEISKKFAALIHKALSESMDSRSMTHILRDLIPSFDLYRHTGTADISHISRIEVADVIIETLAENRLFIQFADILIGIHFNGYKGKKINVSGVNELLKELYNLGFIYDMNTNTIIEDSRYRISRNWGILIDGSDYFFSFLWIDITGYSRIVKKYPKKIVNQLYNDYVTIIRASVERRNGRTWIIEGDGILCSFYYGNKSQLALLSAIEILHKVFTYNRVHNPMEDKLSVKLVINSGMCAYTDDIDRIKSNPVVRATIEMETAGRQSNSVLTSLNVVSVLDPALASGLHPLKAAGTSEYYSYSMMWKD